ncbi:MAG TPA: DUF4112 domain-containing protein [Pyrinomonadaceae bacterium]|nr:DUF4112 domain-containing protein [Pyrinomonadaceae bacterium]
MVSAQAARAGFRVCVADGEASFMKIGAERASDAKNKLFARPSNIQIERELEVLSRVMDNQFRIPILGWRFGLNPIIDLVPGIGDAATTLVALYIMSSAVRYRVSKITLVRMGINIAIYFIVGLIPFAGDAFDAWWKPNIRNITLLKHRATVSAEEARKARKSDWLFVGFIIAILLALLLGSLFITYLILKFIGKQLGMM